MPFVLTITCSNPIHSELNKPFLTVSTVLFLSALHSLIFNTAIQQVINWPNFNIKRLLKIMLIHVSKEFRKKRQYKWPNNSIQLSVLFDSILEHTIHFITNLSSNFNWNGQSSAHRFIYESSMFWCDGFHWIRVKNHMFEENRLTFNYRTWLKVVIRSMYIAHADNHYCSSTQGA